MDDGKFHITVLGSGTSSGVPTIGCKCEVCQSTDPRDKRLRPSILLQFREPAHSNEQGAVPRVVRNIVIDTTPDFRAQVLRTGLERLDAVLYTHAHADHILGLDDVRPFNYFQREVIPLYGTEETFTVIQRVLNTRSRRPNHRSQNSSCALWMASLSCCLGYSSRPFVWNMARERFTDISSEVPLT